MRNYKGSFYRTDEISREPDQCPAWIDLLATKMSIESEKVSLASSKTAVEVARDRNHQPSIYEMMSAIVSGQKPKYSSVEEAVQDYQRQTGLSEYLKRSSGEPDLSVLASQIVTAAKGVCSECGNSYAECECDKDDAKDKSDDEEEEESEDDEDEDEGEEEEEEEEDSSDALDFFRRNLDYGDVHDKSYWKQVSSRHPSDLDEYEPHPSDLEDDEPTDIEFDEPLDQDEQDNGKGRIRDWRDAFKIDPNDPDISDEERNERVEKLLQKNEDYRKDNDYARDMTEEELEENPGKKKLISEAEEEKPELLVKNPSIEHFLTNIIDTNIGIQLPAILHSLIETFSRDGIDYQIFSDRPLLNWINQKLILKGVSKNDTTSQIGRGVGTQVEYSGDKDSNKDPFTLLVPDKSSL